MTLTAFFAKLKDEAKKRTDTAENRSVGGTRRGRKPKREESKLEEAGDASQPQAERTLAEFDVAAQKKEAAERKLIAAENDWKAATEKMKTAEERRNAEFAVAIFLSKVAKQNVSIVLRDWDAALAELYRARMHYEAAENEQAALVEVTPESEISST
eukprot:GEMP01040358.1.p1 GENE.GEMP01040358.1~~GEMP01040358.1.p1  ORF type:complete len:157 (+),score=53.55 GEMP01040358.1:131-601(+)